MSARLEVTVRLVWNRSVRCVAVAFILVPSLFVSTPLGAQAVADSIGRWTTAIQTGTLLSKDSALAKLSALPLQALPAETRAALVAELNRVHLGILAGGNIGMAGEDEDLVADYYMELVVVVARFESQEAALALAPAVSVSIGVARRVARYGDAAVAALLPLYARRYNEDTVMETLGLVWFWADSTGAPLSDRSRTQIVAVLTAAVSSGVHRDLLGLQGALAAIHDPAFLPLANKTDQVAATFGILGRSTVVTMEDDVIPKLTALAASRSPSSLATGLARIVTAVCGNDAAGRRQGACQSIANDVAAAMNHLAKGQTTPARNGFESVGKKIDNAYAGGAFSDAEHALLAGNVAMLLQRLAP